MNIFINIIAVNLLVVEIFQDTTQTSLTSLGYIVWAQFRCVPIFVPIHPVDTDIMLLMLVVLQEKVGC